jgi:hypothetical protein
MSNSKNLPGWLITNAWREIFARIFAGVETRFNVSPEWLVNPTTNRRLKLDMLYPEIGVAVRFEGLQGGQRKSRLSLEEEVQVRTRSDARLAVCQEHGIQLVLVDVVSGKPQTVFRHIDEALGRAAQQPENKKKLSVIKQARTTAATLARKIFSEHDLKLYAELWSDRQYQMAQPAPTTSPVAKPIAYTAGMAVEHVTFGPGVVLSTTASNGDTLVTVDFVNAGRKTLAASLVGDKLLPSP